MLKITRKLRRCRQARKRRSMWRAIQSAAGNDFYANKIHPINGLRVIRTFEQVNGIAFDPDDLFHCMKVASYGRPLSVLKMMRRRLKEASDV